VTFSRTSMNELSDRIEKTIAACKAMQRKGGSGFLPEVIQSLEAMEKALDSGGEASEKRRRRVGGLFRIVSDDAGLRESPLGDELSRIMKTYLAAGRSRGAVRPAKSGSIAPVHLKLAYLGPSPSRVSAAGRGTRAAKRR
jgi:hypothetical protein